MIPDYIFIILSWCLLIAILVLLISDILIVKKVNKRLKKFNEWYEKEKEKHNE